MTTKPRPPPATAVSSGPEDEDEKTRYPLGGLTPQPSRVILPPAPGPCLQTPRLCLRPMKDDDAEELSQLFNGAESKSDWEAWLERKKFKEPPSVAGRRYQFGIVIGSDPTGPIVGTVGMNQNLPLPNVGYGIVEQHRGKGYATEALDAFMKSWWALPRESWDGTEKEKVLANANKENPASLKVLEKCGFWTFLEKTMVDKELLCFLVAEKPDEDEKTELLN